jgi:sortase A
MAYPMYFGRLRLCVSVEPDATTSRDHRHYMRRHNMSSARSLPRQQMRPVKKEVGVLVRLVVLMLFVAVPAANVRAQQFARRGAACRCESDGKPGKRRFLLPIVAGIGFLPVSLAARDNQLPALAMPSLGDIRDHAPRTALAGQRALETGALAPDTATALPTLLVIAGCLVFVGGFLIIPPRRRRHWVKGWGSRPARQHGAWRLRSVHQRRAGFGLAAGGGLLLVLGVREYAEGAQTQRRARAEWLAVGNTIVRVYDSRYATPAAPRLAEADTTARPREALSASVATSVVSLPAIPVSGREIPRGSPVARLSIGSIGMDEIVLEGVGPVELNGGPGHFPGSVLPGAAGNAILSAHRDRHFRRVGELVVGAKIRTETRDGVVDWVVTERRIVSKDTPSLFEETDPTLTLTTCWPVRYFGPAPDRLLIIAKRAG